jgi:hypothetical protein
VADGEVCHNENHDRGDGTFERREVCKTKYRSEPVYDDKCNFTVDRWDRIRSEKNSGGLREEPSWPSVGFLRTCTTLGCEREGPHHETYTVELRSNEATPYTCDKPQAQWRSLVEGATYPMKVRVVGGGADCASLTPQ